MKKRICVFFYSVWALLALAGVVAAVVLYPTHAANGTSAAYFTVILFPTGFLCLGLTGIRFRYWWIIAGALWLGLAGYLLPLEGTGTGLMLLLAGYLFLALAAGFSGILLRRQLSSPK